MEEFVRDRISWRFEEKRDLRMRILIYTKYYRGDSFWVVLRKMIVVAFFVSVAERSMHNSDDIVQKKRELRSMTTSETGNPE